MAGKKQDTIEHEATRTTDEVGEKIEKKVHEATPSTEEMGEQKTRDRVQDKPPKNLTGDGREQQGGKEKGSNDTTIVLESEGSEKGEVETQPDIEV